MRFIVICATLLAILFIATSLWGRTVVARVTSTVHEHTSPEFDIQLAREAVSDLRRELVVDQRNLLGLRRDIERNQGEIDTLHRQAHALAQQIEQGGLLLAQPGPYHIQGQTYSKAQIETQLEAYLSQRAQRRQQQQQREAHQIRLQQKLAEMEVAVANKRLQLEEYEGRIAMLDIDVRFLSRADRYQVSSGNTTVQAIIDRLSDKVEAQRVVSPEAAGIDFISRGAELHERIRDELAQP